MRQFTIGVPKQIAIEQYENNLRRLTPRERQVLERILAAEVPKITARDLGISVRTAHNHRSRIYEKMHARNAVDLMIIASEASLTGAMCQVGQL